jgi:hypothetical protein
LRGAPHHFASNACMYEGRSVRPRQANLKGPFSKEASNVKMSSSASSSTEATSRPKMTIEKVLYLLFDLFVFWMDILWLIFFVRYAMYTPILEFLDDPRKTLFFSATLAILICHGMMVYRNNRIANLQDFVQVVKYWLRDYVTEHIGNFIWWYFLRYLHKRKSCAIINFLLEIFIVSGSLFSAVAAGVQMFYDRDPTFYYQNLMFLILYSAFNVRFKDLYDVTKLIYHFAYISLHLGCVFEYHGYVWSYFYLNLGTVLLILLVIWHFLTYLPIDDSPSHGNLPDIPPGPPGDIPPGAPGDIPGPPGDIPPGPPGDIPPGEGPSDDIPPGDGSVDHTDKSPKSPLWKKPTKPRRRRKH